MEQGHELVGAESPTFALQGSRVRAAERYMDKISDPVHPLGLMKFAFLVLLLPAAALAQGLDGQINIHDPSTIAIVTGSSTRTAPAGPR